MKPVVWYIATPYFTEGFDGSLYQCDDALVTRSIRTFSKQSEAREEATKEERAELRVTLGNDVLHRLCPESVTDQLSDEEYARLNDLLHKGESCNETKDIFQGPFHFALTDAECDEVLEILAHLKWVVGCWPIEQGGM
jgi:hypothetical protein